MYKRQVEKQEVLVSGSPVGIYMETKGVLVIDSGEITDREGIRRTPAEHIIQSGDYICEIDGKVLTGKRQLMQLVRENQGEPMELQVIRHQETIKLEMTPVETLRIVETVRTSDGRMKCCKRDGRNSLTMSHPRGYYMENSEDNQEG